MGARTLEARLTIRLVGLGAAVLVAVGTSALVVTDRVLDRSDTDAARAHATSARDAFDVEIGEGDSPDQALHEVMTAAQAEGAKVAIRQGETTVGAAMLPLLPAGACVTLTDSRDEPWRACGAADDRSPFVTAGIPIGARKAAFRTLVRGMAAILALALIAMWIAVRRALRGPVSEIAAVARWTARVADDEQVSAPPRSETLEILQLESAFDALVRQLLDALARERANSAHIAHELRTPLTAIVAELEAMVPPEAELAAALARVRADVARLADVIEAILVLSGTAARGHDAERAKGSAEAVVNLADLARELAPAGARVDAPDEALIEADERLVRLAVRNLVENAARYAGGARTLRITREGAGARFAVIDEGPGLDAGARARMFERYWRGSADGDGRGLGLALVRAVAERCHGRAEARTGAGERGLEVSMTFDRLVGWHRDAPAPGDVVKEPFGSGA